VALLGGAVDFEGWRLMGGLRSLDRATGEIWSLPILSLGLQVYEVRGLFFNDAHHDVLPSSEAQSGPLSFETGTSNAWAKTNRLFVFIR
jgi:hypothetical protein